MTIEQFIQDYSSYRWNETVTVNCSNAGCSKEEKLWKQSAIRNIEKNGTFICRSCSFTDEGRQKISQATSYRRSDATKKRMSEAKLAFFQTERGKEIKRMLSRKASLQHASRNVETTRRRGLYPSKKNDDFVVYGSSYELKAILDLENDPEVLRYETQVPYEGENQSRSMDIIIYYRQAGRKPKCIEVKAAGRLNEEKVNDQIEDGAAWADSQDYDYEVWTEQDLGFASPKEATVWADKFISTLTGIDYAAVRMQMNREKAKRHYDAQLSRRIEVYCDYCKESHEIREAQYLKNVEKNGRFICIKENGAIIGSRPKDYLRKENPHAAKGKKECSKCKDVKILDDFGNDKAKRDGKAGICKTCRAAKSSASYQAKKRSPE